MLERMRLGLRYESSRIFERVTARVDGVGRQRLVKVRLPGVSVSSLRLIVRGDGLG
jgi:hypothetical protein